MSGDHEVRRGGGAVRAGGGRGRAGRGGQHQADVQGGLRLGRVEGEVPQAELKMDKLLTLNFKMNFKSTTKDLTEIIVVIINVKNKM